MVSKERRKNPKKRSENRRNKEEVKNTALPTVAKGSELEDLIAKLAERHGWRVEKRKKFNDRVLDLVVKKGSVIFVVQCKNTIRASPSDVTQTRRDFDAYVSWLLEEKLKVQIVPILVSNDFSKRARERARSYGVFLYTVDELKELLSKSKRVPIEA